MCLNIIINHAIIIKVMESLYKDFDREQTALKEVEVSADSIVVSQHCNR